jgi:hypothetical protein
VGVQGTWDLVLHILSFLNFDTARARQMLAHVAPAPRAGAPALPWAGSSLVTYLEVQGLGALDEVSRWVTSFRFGAPSLSPEQDLSCPSKQG